MPHCLRLHAIALCLVLASVALAQDEPPTADMRGRNAFGDSIPPLIDAPVGDVERLLQAGSRVLAVTGRNKVVDLATGEVVLHVKDDDDFSVASVMCDANDSGYVVCLYRGSKSTGEGDNRQSYTKLAVMDSRGKRKKIGQGNTDKKRFTPLGVGVDPQGRVAYAYERSEKKGDDWKTSRRVNYDGDEFDLPFKGASLAAKLAWIGGRGRRDPAVMFQYFEGALYMIARQKNAIVLAPVRENADVVTVAALSQYDVRPVVTSDGFFYIFFHDPKGSSTHVAVSRDAREWDTRYIDGKESGWQMEACAHGDTAYAVYYYYRNSFNKGLKVATVRGGEPEGFPYTVVREEAHNTGWFPFFGVAADGTVWLSYWHDILKKERVWHRFDSPGHLEEYRILPTGRWEDRYKPITLLGGVGGWYTMWNPIDIVPKPEYTANLSFDRNEYDVANKLLFTGAFEARIFGIDLAVSYAQSIMDEALAEVEESTGIVSGNVKINKAFPGHDVKVQFTWGRYRGAVLPADLGDASLEATPSEWQEVRTDYIDSQAIFLNKYRVKYGITFTKYSLPTTLHTWYRPGGSTSYSYTGSYFRDVDFNNVRFMIGTSVLDYVGKYENRFNKPFVDAAFDVGFTIMRFDRLPTPESPEKGVNFTMRGVFKVGFLSMNRWYASRGLGFYVRPAYQLEVALIGIPVQPKDRDEASDSSSTIISPGILSFRHGPWLDFGLVW